MTMEIDRDALLGALREVATVVPGRTTIPVLANVLMECADGKLSITASDLDLQATTTVEAAGDLSITLPADKVQAAVQSLRPGRIVLEPVVNRPGSMRFKQGRNQRTLAGLPAKDFPKRADLLRAKSFAMPAAALARLLETTQVAQSTEETRYYMCGVFLHVFDGQLYAAASDGHRLVRCAAETPDGAAGMPDSIVGSKVVALLRKLLGKFEGTVQLAFTDRAVTFTLGQTVINAGLINGTFPDYRRVIPQPNTTKLIASRNELVGAAGGVIAIVSGEGKDKVRKIKVEIGGDGECELSTQDDTGADASELVTGAVTGRSQAFGVNGKYFASALGIFSDAAQVSIAFDSPSDAILITAETDPDLLAVVMPMRV